LQSPEVLIESVVLLSLDLPLVDLQWHFVELLEDLLPWGFLVGLVVVVAFYLVFLGVVLAEFLLLVEILLQLALVI
jgi:hypothetical protein